MSDQVSVRLAVVGGTQFRSELKQAGAEGARSMQQIQAASRGVSPALQQVGREAAIMFGSMAGGAPAVATLASGLGRAALAGAAFGGPVGVIAAAMSSLVPLLFSGGKAADEMATGMKRAEGSIGAVNGAVSALEAVQRTYVDAINSQGGASSAAARLVFANSKAEFDARKQLLSLELELLKARGETQAAELRESEGIFRRDYQKALGVAQEVATAPSGYTGDAAAEAAYRLAGVRRPDGMAAQVVADAMKQKKERLTDMRRLRAEAVLTGLAISKTEEAMATTFQDITTGAPAKGTGTGTAAGAGKGGGGAVNKSLEEGKRLFEQTRTAAEKYAAEMARLNDLLRAGAIDQDTYSRAVLEAAVLGQGPLAQLLGTGPKTGGGGGTLLGGLFGAIFGGKREMGGPVQAGKAYLVGEKRPELFVPGTSGTILPDVGRATAGKQASAGALQILIGFDASVGGFTAMVRDEAGRVVAQAAPAIIGQARQATMAGMNRTKAGWG